jgi:hypothetical protein
MTKLIDVVPSWDANADGLFVRKDQHLSDDFLTSLKEEKNNSSEVREGEYMRVASIPVIVVEKWIREGFNILDGTKTPQEIIKRLKAENLEDFITTEKNV